MAVKTSKGLRGTTIVLTGRDASDFFRARSAAAEPTYAYAFATGVIGIGTTVPSGALEIAHGCKQDIEELIAGSARLAHDNTTFLVPGVPEAASQDAGVDALLTYLRWIKPRSHGALFVKGA